MTSLALTIKVDNLLSSILSKIIIYSICINNGTCIVLSK